MRSIQFVMVVLLLLLLLFQCKLMHGEHIKKLWTEFDKNFPYFLEHIRLIELPDWLMIRIIGQPC